MGNGFDGCLTVITGWPRQGKTSFAIPLLKKPHVIACAGASNETLQKYSWVPDTDKGLKYVSDHPTETLAIRCMHANPNLFKVLCDPAREVMLDEVGNICCTYQLKEAFVKYAREVGWKNGGLNVTATTQRPKSDIPPAVYDAARKIYWVGPCRSRTITNLLYDRTSLIMSEEEFELMLFSRVPFKYDKPNPKEAVFLIKDI